MWRERQAAIQRFSSSVDTAPASRSSRRVSVAPRNSSPAASLTPCPEKYSTSTSPGSRSAKKSRVALASSAAVVSTSVRTE